MFLYFLCLVGLVVAQTSSPSTILSSILAAKGLTTFKSYLDKYQSFSDQLASGNVTILAPTNDAFAAYLSTVNVNLTTPDAVLATLQYHVLLGRYPVLSQIQQPLLTAGDQPEFLATLLSNASYANVTGGQRVEALFTNNHMVFRSGIKQDSAVTIPDIPYQQSDGLPGLIQVIDRVLTVPSSSVSTVKAANLTAAYNLISKLPQETSQNSVGNKWKYVTLFFPNDNIPDFSQYTTDYLVHEQDYHLFPNELRFSPDLSDGLSLQSNQGGNATIKVVNGSTYVNAAKIVSTDYLVYNGVMHILDRPLNFSLPNELPAPPHTVDATPIPSPQSNPDALPIGAKIGIGLVVGITVMGLIGIAIYYWRRRSGRKEPISELHGQYVLENVHELASPHVVPELDDKAQIVAELPAEIWNMNPETSSLKELDTNERLDVIKTDARSRRKSDEIRLMRKHEQNMIRVENERENTQSPINKLAKENKMDNGLDDGVHRPSDHVPQPTSPEDFGLHQILEGREVERPAEENYLERVITSETPHRSQPSESTITGGSRSPVSPVFVGEAPASPRRDFNWEADGLYVTPVNTGMPEGAKKDGN